MAPLQRIRRRRKMRHSMRIKVTAKPMAVAVLAIVIFMYGYIMHGLMNSQSPALGIRQSDDDSASAKKKKSHYPFQITPKTSFTSQEQDAIGRSQPPEVFHDCTCLDDKRPVRNVNYDWLHIPKTGTSFIITYWNLALNGMNIDYNFSGIYGLHGLSYDLVIQDRYPLELYAANSSLLASHNTRHLPLDESLGHDYVTVFRDPKERVLSAYFYSMLSDGFNLTEYRDLARACPDSLRFRQHPLCYANYPGIPHCMTKMLLGYRCSSSFVPRESDVQRAKQILKEMAFVGLMEEYNEGICQFYKTFGGIPPQGSFQNVNPGKRARNATVVENYRRKYRDDIDQALYDLAKEEFYHRYLPDGQRCYQKLVAPKSLQACWPKTCHDLGKQCGEWPDGCGGVLVCGLCPLHRAESFLPISWRVECSSEGQCIFTCPLWVESGVWFSEQDLWVEQFEENGVPAELIESVVPKHDVMLPSDAFKICDKLCRSQLNTSFAQQLCRCVNFPFPDSNPSFEDLEYKKMMDMHLNDKHLVEYQRVMGFISISFKWNQFSLPRCCESEHPPDESWREGSLYAKYYASFDMGCGSYEECADLGKQDGAEAVVFCKATNLCHLGRDVHNKTIRGSNHEKAGKFHLILKDLPGSTNSRKGD